MLFFLIFILLSWWFLVLWMIYIDYSNDSSMFMARVWIFEAWNELGFLSKIRGFLGILSIDVNFLIRLMFGMNLWGNLMVETKKIKWTKKSVCVVCVPWVICVLVSISICFWCIMCSVWLWCSVCKFMDKWLSWRIVG